MLPKCRRSSRLLSWSALALAMTCMLATPALADTPTATGSATPATVPFGTSTLLTATVVPASSPASTGISVTADLSSIGGSPAAQLYDDHTHGDVTSGDNVFSFSFIPLVTVPGVKTIPVTVTDAQSRTASATITLTLTAPANVFAVNSSADGPVDAGGCTPPSVCTLRDAVAAANAATGASKITVPAAHYLLNPGASPLGQLAVTKPIEVLGDVARSTIVDANHASRVFAVNSTSGPPLLLSGLTITGGSTPTVPPESTDPGDGGGVFSQNRLALDHVAITGNVAALGGGGVMNGTVHNGPSQPPQATFNSVTIANNQVKGGAGNGQGGGAVVATDLVLINSTITANSASDAGINEGGGLVSTDGVATLLNDTISGNSSAKPIASPAGDFGGGISGDAIALGAPYNSTLRATNTIVAGNSTDGAEHNCDLLNTSGASSSHNIEGDATCGFNDAGTQQTTALKLGPLQDNGGATDTLLPMSGSPTIDRADASACPSLDQRGVIRPQGSGCDIGAAELAPPSATTGPATGVSQTAATLTATASNPAVSAGAATFQYGTSIAYGPSAAGGSVAGANAAVSPSAALAGLSPATTYHYRVVVTTTDGQAIGSDATFTTPPAPPPPQQPKKPPVPTHCASIRVIRFHIKHLVFGSLRVSVNGRRVTPRVELTGRHRIPAVIVSLRGAPRSPTRIRLSGRQRTHHHGTVRFSQTRLFHPCVRGPH
jgi:hypothetical protein